MSGILGHPDNRAGFNPHQIEQQLHGAGVTGADRLFPDKSAIDVEGVVGGIVGFGCFKIVVNAVHQRVVKNGFTHQLIGAVGDMGEDGRDCVAQFAEHGIQLVGGVF